MRHTPGQLLSALAGKLASNRNPLLSRTLIRAFALKYRVDMRDAAEPELSCYRCFNDFFTRALCPGSRPIDHQQPEVLVSPADGQLSLLPHIDNDNLIQAKGRHYTISELLGGPETEARGFENGACVTVYLSPRNYHRVHMPLSGTLVGIRYRPGSLFPVNPFASRRIDRLFARNERLICLFENPSCRFALVFVAALLVNGIRTVWMPDRAPGTEDTLPNRKIMLTQGEEVGRFLMGSTVVLLCSRPLVDTISGTEGQAVRMGETLASLKS